MSEEQQGLPARNNADGAAITESQDAPEGWITQDDAGEYLYSVELIEQTEGPSVGAEEEDGVEDDLDEELLEYQSVEVHGVIVYGTAPGQRLPGYLSKEQKAMVQGLSAQLDLGAGADGDRVRSLFGELAASGLVLAGELSDLRLRINRDVPHAGLVAEEGR
ncbi:hypothetical protein APB26_32910 [Pseudomonas aeruginosa]|uniref:hypothetical protein n=1 Tax=Pseudomonas aeruginosa TaxID=287 RepID=UPI00071C04F4|nr:hypothetical protein [Pseudomonas aeruginosa]KSQ21782.1 hypothetical protein APB26_32910 [Pseudomonas aeruginosa]RPV61456.1 hypothetical protein IPC838_19255 [Pseudomonas aeruginosa]